MAQLYNAFGLRSGLGFKGRVKSGAWPPKPPDGGMFVLGLSLDPPHEQRGFRSRPGIASVKQFAFTVFTHLIPVTGRDADTVAKVPPQWA